MKEMRLDLYRVRNSKTFTLGQLFIDEKLFCDTLENPVVDLDKSGKFEGDEKKIWGESAIPYGEFEVKLGYSPKFKRILPRVQNVPHFEGILFHSGNYVKHTAGCILVGEGDGKTAFVGNSRATEKKLVEMLEQAEKDNKKIILAIK